MLKAYIFAIVHNPELAEDTLGDVAVEVARCWADFDPTRAPFTSWARGIARRVALANLRKRSGRTLLMDAAVLESVASEIDQFGDEAWLERRKHVLHNCVSKLSALNQQLIAMRYREGRSYSEIAAALKREANALYVAFNRIHQSLSECVQRGMSAS